MPASNGKNEVYELKTKIKVKEDTIVYFITQYRDWNDDTKNKCALYKDSKLKKKMFNIDIQCNGSYRVAYLEKGTYYLKNSIRSYKNKYSFLLYAGGLPMSKFKTTNKLDLSEIYVTTTINSKIFGGFASIDEGLVEDNLKIKNTENGEKSTTFKFNNGKCGKYTFKYNLEGLINNEVTITADRVTTEPLS